MEDNAGMDEKIVAVPTDALTTRYSHIKNYDQLPDILIKQIEHFFAHYKDLEPGKWVNIARWGNVTEAKSLIEEAIERAA